MNLNSNHTICIDITLTKNSNLNLNIDKAPNIILPYPHQGPSPCGQYGKVSSLSVLYKGKLRKGVKRWTILIDVYRKTFY